MIYLTLAALVGILVLSFWILRIPRCGNMVLVTGGIKTGKTWTAVHIATRLLRRQRIKCALFNAFRKPLQIITRKPKFAHKRPRPLLYTNVPLNVPYSPLTEALLRREERFVYGSVIYVCEESLVADSMTFRDDELNERLLLLHKLIAHETRGGYLVLDTQSVSDCHYSVKRCLNTYLYLASTYKPWWLPFGVMKYREMYYSDDQTSITTQTEAETLKWCIVPKKVWRLYDCYCYSALTDELPVSDTIVEHPPTLKAHTVVSLKHYSTLKKGKPK